MKGADEAEALAPLAKALGLTIRRRKKLDSIRMLKEAMLEILAHSGQGRRKENRFVVEQVETLPDLRGIGR